MFSKTSRYYKLENTAKPDSGGRVFESKALRLLPDVSGQFEHVVEDTDRLDNLAYKYYKKPRQWWRLCDGNPEFISPRGLLGKEPARLTRFDLQWDGLIPPWHELRTGLERQLGVDGVLFGGETQPYPDQTVFETDLLFSLSITLQSDIQASIPRQQLTSALDAAFAAEGHALGGDVHLEEIEANHWRLTERTTRAIYTIRVQGGALNVYESAIRFTWFVTVSYNVINVDSDSLSEKIESLGSPAFTVLSPAHIGRTGKPIIVPPGTAAG